MSLADIDVSSLEHVVQSCLESSSRSISSCCLGLEVADTEDRLKELGVVETVLDAERIIYWHDNSINLLEGLEHANNFLSAASKAHKFAKVEEALERDHLILSSLIERIKDRCVVFEVFMQFEMED